MTDPRTADRPPAGRDPLHLTRADVDRLIRYAHPIPICRGYAQEYVTRTYPGWEWNDLLPVLKRCGALGTVAGRLQLLHGDGVVLDGTGRCTVTSHEPAGGN